MHPTRNDLSPDVREPMIRLLCDRLADAIDLQSHLRHAHWNVKGPQFIALHELFGKLSGELDAVIDDLAERAVQLGGTPRGTVRHAAKQSSLSEYATDAAGGPDHCRALSASLSAYGASVRRAIDAAAERGDAGTADLFTAISRDADKALWLIESHTLVG
jgi:starvation-inducible DNA-binding protein